VTDFIGRKRVAYISYGRHSDFLETLRVYHGWQWSIYDGELGRIVARGEAGINARSARQAAEAEWRKYRNAPPDAAVKWRTFKSDMGETVHMAKKKNHTSASWDAKVDRTERGPPKAPDARRRTEVEGCQPLQ
jgi:hypothetical protein